MKNDKTKKKKKTVTLDFTDYPVLLQKLKDVAKQEMRTPAMQAMYYLKTIPSINKEKK